MVKENYWPNYTTNVMTFHSVLSTLLSSVAASLQHLRTEFSFFFNWYVMPELVVTTQTFLIDFLELDFRSRVIWLQVITIQVLWSSSWTRGSLRCSHLYHENWFVQRVMVFTFSFVYLGLDFVGVSGKAEDAYPTGALGPCSQF